MENKRPLILISNDDGVMAKGISELIKFLRPLGEIVVMAPDTARSGSGCAITVTQPVHYQLVRKEVGLTVYKCSGTPADCIKLAWNTVLDRKPDLVVGGVNHGDNSATNVHYSGTMGIVIEGCLNGIPSIGFSLCSHDPGADFESWLSVVFECLFYFFGKCVRYILSCGIRLYPHLTQLLHAITSYYFLFTQF